MLSEHRPMATVAVPVYNAEKYLNQCIESIIGQTYKDFELILLPGASQDNSTAICEEWVKKDPRLRIVVQDRNNVSYARNLAVQNASGKYLCYCDADDVYCEDYLEKMLTKAEEDGADVVECMFYIANEDLSEASIYSAIDKVDVWGHDHLERHAAPAVWKYIVRLDYLRENGFFYPETRTMEDLAAYSLIFSMTEKISYVYEPLYVWRTVGDSLSHEKKDPEILLDSADTTCSYISSQFREKGLFEKKQLVLLSQIENHLGDIFGAIKEDSDMGEVSDRIDRMIRKYYGAKETLFECGVLGWGYHDLERLLFLLRKNPTKALNFISDAKMYYMVNQELRDNVSEQLSNGIIDYFVIDFIADALEVKEHLMEAAEIVKRWVSGMQIMAEVISNSGVPHVFLLERYLSEKYISDVGETEFLDVDVIRATNDILAKMYGLFKKLCPKIEVIDSMSQESNVSDSMDSPLSDRMLAWYYYERIMDRIHSQE